VCVCVLLQVDASKAEQELLRRQLEDEKRRVLEVEHRGSHSAITAQWALSTQCH